jgi:hypothetical protein
LPISGKTVFIVINGKVILRDHKMDEPYSYNVFQCATKGSILGVSALDNGLSCSSTIWAVVGSTYAEVISMNIDTFDMLWKQA